jgi:hypothetical protein
MGLDLSQHETCFQSSVPIKTLLEALFRTIRLFSDLYGMVGMSNR